MPCRGGLWNNINSRERRGNTLKLYHCQTLPSDVAGKEYMNKEPLRPIMKEDLGSGSFFSSFYQIAYLAFFMSFSKLFSTNFFDTPLTAK